MGSHRDAHARLVVPQGNPCVRCVGCGRPRCPDCSGTGLTVKACLAVPIMDPTCDDLRVCMRCSGFGFVLDDDEPSGG